jgi:hypothetical protein
LHEEQLVVSAAWSCAARRLIPPSAARRNSGSLSLQAFPHVVVLAAPRGTNGRVRLGLEGELVIAYDSEPIIFR